MNRRTRALSVAASAALAVGGLGVAAPAQAATYTSVGQVVAYSGSQSATLKVEACRTARSGATNVAVRGSVVRENLTLTSYTYAIKATTSYSTYSGESWRIEGTGVDGGWSRPGYSTSQQIHFAVRTPSLTGTESLGWRSISSLAVC